MDVSVVVYMPTHAVEDSIWQGGNCPNPHSSKVNQDLPNVCQTDIQTYKHFHVSVGFLNDHIMSFFLYFVLKINLEKAR